MLPTQERIEYRLARPSDADQIVRLIAIAFSRYEPLAIAMGLSIEEMEEFLRPLVPAAIPQGLTMVAREANSNELIGALLNDDLAAPLPVDPSKVITKYLPIIALLNQLEDHYHDGRTIPPGECLHMFMLAADDRFKGCNLGHTLVSTSLHNAARKGYRAAVAETTAGASQHIFRRLGFTERISIAYADFIYQDQAVFRSIRNPASAILMEKSLSQ